MKVCVRIQSIEETARSFLRLTPIVKQVNESRRSASYLDRLKLEMGELTQQGKVLRQVQGKWEKIFAQQEGEILLFGLRLLNEPNQLNKLGLDKSEYADLAEVFRLASKNWQPNDICQITNYQNGFHTTCRPSKMLYSLYVECKKLAEA